MEKEAEKNLEVNDNFEERKNLLKINGKGKKLCQTAQEYIDLINDDYNVTVDEICEYLRVSKAYWNKYKLEIKHIYINTVIRAAIIIELEGEEFPLIMKKVLYSRKSFENFIKENFIIEKKSVKISRSIIEKYDDFDIDLYYKVMKYSNVLGLTQKDPIVLKTKIDTPELPEIVDYKDIMNIKGYAHSTLAYRFIENNRLDRYIFGNSIRYTLDNLNGATLSMPFELFSGFSKKELLETDPEILFKSFLKRTYKKFPKHLNFIKELEEAQRQLQKMARIRG